MRNHKDLRPGLHLAGVLHLTENWVENIGRQSKS